MAFVGSSVAAGALIGGGSLVSGLLGSNAAKSAANKQSDAGGNALALQKQMYDATRSDTQPYRDIGRGATYTLGSLYGIGQDGNKTNAPVDYSAFSQSPDYGFAQQQGELGLTRAENARGMNLSGGALKDFAQFNQGLASQQYGNYFNRLMGLSQLGTSAAQISSGSAANFSGQMSNSITGQGQAQASGIVGSANALTGGIGSGINNSLLYNAINRSSYAPAGNTSLPNNGTGMYTGDPTVPGFG